MILGTITLIVLLIPTLVSCNKTVDSSVHPNLEENIPDFAFHWQLASKAVQAMYHQTFSLRAIRAQIEPLGLPNTNSYSIDL